MLAAATPPDTVCTFPRSVSALYAHSVFLSLNESLDDWGFKTEDFLEGDILGSNFMGRQYGIPLWQGSVYYTGLYRKDLFDEAGVPYPKGEGEPGFEDWTKLYEAGKQLMVRDASGNVTRWGWDNSSTWAGMRVLGAIKEQGGNWFDEGTQQFTLTSDEVVNAIRTLLFDATFEYGISWDINTRPETQRDQRFIDGEVPMVYFIGPVASMLSENLTDMMEVTEAFEVPPMVPGGPNYMMKAGGWSQHAIASAPAEHHSAAIRFATIHIRDLDVAAAIHKAIGVGSSLKAYVDHPYLEEIAAENKANAIRAWQYRATIRNGSIFCGWEWGNLARADWIGGHEDRILGGEVTPEQLAEEWQQEATTARVEFYKDLGIPVA
jgi:ABC-type glycerol-3-phosphate transport system substrate-binding protein